MIELIFVIVVLGVLAGVALPKFLEIHRSAEDQVVESFAATMTRTVGHSLWSKSIFDGKNGTINYGGDSSKFAGKGLESYVDIPVELDASSVDFRQCVQSSGTASPFLSHAAGYEYNIFCRDGNQTDAPKFVAAKGSTYVF